MGTKVNIGDKDKSTSYVIDDKNDTGFARGDDLTGETKETLGSYLNQLQPNANVFKVTNENPTVSPVFNQITQRSPSVVWGGAADDGTQKWKDFIDSAQVLDSNIDMIGTMFNEVPVDVLGGEATLETFLAKAVKTVSGHVLLSNVQAAGGLYGNTEETRSGRSGAKDPILTSLGPSGGSFPGLGLPTYIMQEKIVGILGTNRFSPGADTPFIRGGKSAPVAHVQGELGVWKSGDGTPAITFKQLSEIGTALMVRSTGHSYAEGGFGDVQDIYDALLLPTGPQLQLNRVSVTDIDVANVMRDLKIYGSNESKFQIPDSTISSEGEAGSGTSALGFRGASMNDMSYGSLNSPGEMFDGPAPLGMVILAATSLVSIILLSFFINECVNGFSSNADKRAGGTVGKRPARPLDPSTLEMGTAIPGGQGGGDFLMRMMGIPQLTNQFAACFTYGIQAFYGFAEGSLTDMMSGQFAAPSMEFIIASAENLLLSSGYYAGIMRAVVRDIEQITGQGEAVASSMGLSDGAQAVFGIIQAIATSTTWRFIMTMATIGDCIINDKFRVVAPTAKDPGKVETLPAIRHYQQRRLGTSQWTLGASQTPGLYLLPGSFALAYLSMGSMNAPVLGPDAIISLGETLEWNTYKGVKPFVSTGGMNETYNTPKGISTQLKTSTSTSMISHDLVNELEDILEGEYFPFYFHDLRTNEIIAFQAFLTTLGETFSPTWNSTGGIGRIDEVMTYQKTSRTFDLSFVIVSTNREDFDHMWWKINKLTAMVYPQWSPGKMLEAPAGERFRMPFSQVPTASPIIRLRVGDVMKSNYSRFNLARLFGAGEPEVGASFGKASGDSSTTPENLRMAAIAREVQVKSLQGDVLARTDETNPQAQLGIDGNWEGLWRVGDLVQVKRSCSAVDHSGIAIDLWDHEVYEITEFTPRDPQATTPTDSKGFRASGFEYSMKLAYAHAIDTVRVDEDKGRKLATWVDQLLLTLCWTKQMTDIIGPEADDLMAIDHPDVVISESFKKFLNDNAIVRSFESSMSRGMAGAITNLSFDYANSVYDTSMGRRAPMSVVVNMGFTAIHDITPGLDHFGMLRAPTHNVGRYMIEGFGDVYEQANMMMAGEQQQKALSEIGAAPEDTSVSSPPEAAATPIKAPSPLPLP